MAPQPATTQTLASYLATGYWLEKGGDPHDFDTNGPGVTTVITVNIAGLTAAGQTLARAALDAWETVANISFSLVASGGQMVIDDTDTGADTDVWYNPANGDMLPGPQGQAPATVIIGTDWLSKYGTQVGDYSFHTFMHEIGHALGLGHSGNYNSSADYATDAKFQNDSWQQTVMSYFDQNENTHVHATKAYTVTPMMADIVAIQQLYGAARGGPTAGNTAHGINSNLGTYLDAVYRGTTGSLAKNAFTIFDEGGIDTLTLSNDSLAQRVNLAGGTFSDVYGLKGNLGIAVGTVIENYVAGGGADSVTGNAANNVLTLNGGHDRGYGGAGSDTLRGGAGNDLLDGGAGTDRLEGGLGNDTYVLAGPGDAVVEGAGAGIDQVNAGSSYNLGLNVENLLLTGTGAFAGNGNALNNRLTGNAGANVLKGGGGNDILDGGPGPDRLEGGLGNDTYILATAGDTVVEGTGAGIDQVNAGFSYNLGLNVENLLLTGTGAFAGNGNALGNRLTGNAGANVLNGGGGNDALLGGAGNDRLDGGAGNDALTGQAGSDSFVFGGGRDTVTDFADNVDTLLLDDALWGNQPLTVAQVLAKAEAVAGGVLFDFGNGHTLKVNGVASVNALADDLAFV